MQKLAKILSSSKWFFTGFAIVIVLGLVPQLLYSQNKLFLFINGWHSKFFDTFFYLLTYFGDGITFVLLILALLFISYSDALIGLIIFLITSLIAQGLKHIFFADHYRPFKVLSGQYQLHIPAGVDPIVSLSFPSGHTVTAFAMATFLVMTLPTKKIKLLLLILATLTAYSRVYLTHHFPVDVWAGALIGTLGAILIYWLVGDKFDHKLGQKSLLNR